MTFSRALNSSNSVMIWNERATPLPAIACGAIPATSSPSRRMRPRLGFTRPVSTLKNVVLPAPFGPMMPCSSPSVTSRSISSSTTRSPKRTCTPRFSAIIQPGAIETVCAHSRSCAEPGDAFRPEQHHRHEKEAEVEHPGEGEGADHVARDEEVDDADHRPPELTRPPPTSVIMTMRPDWFTPSRRERPSAAPSRRGRRRGPRRPRR